ncbi:MAG TPA: Nmad5 family putative nucleotide modification protein, partial [Noviherbaspirillum sp.]|nr:Nmad5 family putative nucleotide modification protein [Noviherbaspirillum sp.]
GEQLAKTLPPEWLAKMETVYISCEGFLSHLYHPRDDEPHSALKLSRPRLRPSVITTQFTVEDGHPLYQNAQAVLQQFNAIKTGKEELSAQLRTLLFSIFTMEKLKDVWPAGEAFFPPVTTKQALPIPYDLTLTINRMMGISTSAKEIA